MKPDRARWMLALLMLGYILAYGWLVVQRHAHFNSAGYDLGLQDQVVWNTSRGDLYHTSLETENYLGDHFQPLMALLSPLYWLAPGVYWLLGFQTLALALGAVPVFRLARRRCGSSAAGLVFALAYLMYPAVGYVNRFDFHWEATVIPLLLAAADWMEEGRLGWASACLALALLCKEEIGLTVAAFGLVAALRGRPKFGAVWGVTGAAFSLLALFVLIPAFRAAPSDTLARYAWLGGAPVEMVKTLITHPQALWEQGRLGMALSLGVQLLAPAAFLPLLGPEWLIAALPSLAYNLLSAFPPQHTIYYQYIAPTVPWMFVGAIEGAARLQRWFVGRARTPYVRRALLAALALCAVRASMVDSPLADLGRVPPAWARLPNEADVREALTCVPPDAALFTTNPYAPHLSHRRTLIVFVYPNDATRLGEADAAFFNLLDRRSVAFELGCEDYRRFLEAAAQAGMALVFEQNGVVVLRRGAGEPLAEEEIERLVGICYGAGAKYY